MAVKRRAADFDPEEVDATLNHEPINASVVDHWREKARGPTYCGLYVHGGPCPGARGRFPSQEYPRGRGSWRYGGGGASAGSRYLRPWPNPGADQLFRAWRGLG